MTNSESPLKPKQVKNSYYLRRKPSLPILKRVYRRDDLILISFKNKSNLAGVFTKSTAASEALNGVKNNKK